MIRKWLAIGIILLFVGVTIAPTINFNTVKASNDNDLVKEGKADLIIGKIEIHSGDAPTTVQAIVCWVNNIGDAPTSGNIEVHLTIKRLIFGIIPYGNFNANDDFVIQPGGVRIFAFHDIPDPVGIFKFIFTVNPDKSIEESDYSNNRRTAIYLVITDQIIGGWWRLY